MMLAIFVMFAISFVTMSVEEMAYGITGDSLNGRKAPIATSGENMYISWSTNKTGNYEIMFRASTNNTGSFGEIINLSNTTNTDSIDVYIEAQVENVYVSWWERNATSDEPVLRISNDSGQTFGPIIWISQNQTIGQEENIPADTGEIKLDTTLTENGTLIIELPGQQEQRNETEASDTENDTFIIDPEDQYLPQLAANQTEVSVTENGTIVIEPPIQQQGANQTESILDQISNAFSGLFGG